MADARPKYQRLVDRLRSAIADLPVGASVPSERALADDAGVSRMTARKALDALEAEGLLRREVGRGTFVSRPAVSLPLMLTSFSEDMRARGLFRCLGINTHSARTMQRISAEPGLFDVALVDYNILQLDREPLLQAMDAAGIGVLAGTVLAQGHLLPGRIHRVRSLADVWYFARAKLKPTGRELAAAARAMGPVLSQVDGLSAAQAAAAWVLPGLTT